MIGLWLQSRSLILLLASTILAKQIALYLYFDMKNTNTNTNTKTNAILAKLILLLSNTILAKSALARAATVIACLKANKLGTNSKVL